MTYQTRAETFGATSTHGTNGRKKQTEIHDGRNAIIIAIHADVQIPSRYEL